MCGQLNMSDLAVNNIDMLNAQHLELTSSFENELHAPGESPQDTVLSGNDQRVHIMECSKKVRPKWTCTESRPDSKGPQKISHLIPEAPSVNVTKSPGRKMALLRSHIRSSPSDNSLGNSGAEYDSGAQDLSEEPQSLHLLLRSEHPDLYHMFFPHNTQKIPTSDLSSTPHQNTYELMQNNSNAKSSDSALQQRDVHEGQYTEATNLLSAIANWTKPASESNCSSPASPHSPDWVRRLFECANVVHMQHTGRLRSELLDLSHRLQGLQASRDFGLREIQRIKRERDQMRNQLANQAAHYEDRLTELHSVIAELRRRLDHGGVNAIREVDEVQEEEDEIEEVTSAGRCAVNFTQRKHSYPLGTSAQNAAHHTISELLPNYSRPSQDEDAFSDGSTDGDTSIGAVDGDHLERGELSKSRLENTLAELHLPSTSLSKSISRPDLGCPQENRTTVIDYEASIARLRAQLACVIEERDTLAHRLNLSRSSSAAAPVDPGSTDESQNLNASQDPLSDLAVDPLNRKSATITSRPIMGLSRHLQAKQVQICDPTPHSSSVPSQSNPGTISTESSNQRGVDFCSVNSDRIQNPSSEAISSCLKEVSTDNNIYDLPEPDWITMSLRHYEESLSNQHRASGLNNTNNSEFTESSSTAEQSESFDQLWLDAEDSVLRGPLSPRAVLQFLASLAKLAPYPRLVDVANCAQLTWSRLLSTLSRLQSDCLVLQTNLAEVKSTADRIQCQMNQIEANWSAALRCASLADACLEIADCLNQLYSTELAIVLYRHSRKLMLSGRGCSTLSSSTSSSSFPGRHIKASVGGSNGINKVVNQGTVTSGQSLSSTSPYHPYAVYAVPGSIGTESNDISSMGFLTTQCTLKNLKLFRHQAELMAHSLLDRYDLTDANPERFYPTTSSSSTNGGGLPSLSRAFSRPSQQAPVSPGLFSVLNSPLGPNIPSAHSLTNTSLYANSWYVSLGRLGHVTATSTANHGEQTSLGSCAGSGSLLSKPPGTHLLPFSPARNSTKSAGHHSSTLPETGGGWQTPDSGAGSSGTNEVLHQPNLLHHPFFPTLGCLAAASNHVEPSPYSTLLDMLPPMWFNPMHRAHEHSICDDTDSDSSDSSDGIGTAATGSKIREHPITPDPHALHLSTWTRIEERKLRNLLNYLMHARRLVRSTMSDVQLFGNNTEEDNESRRTCDSIKLQEDFGRLLNSSSISSLGKLSLNVLMENSVLLQELCHVKEERADLNARVYLLEKELHANRLTLESHVAAEQALRAHLDVLVTEQNYRLTKTDGTSEVEKSSSSRTGQSEISLLRGQVKNLLQALEALRHSTELQQLQSEELVDDLKRANTALIGAYDKAKRKYLTRIRKLEDQIGSLSSVGEKRAVLMQPTCSSVQLPTSPDVSRVSTVCRENTNNNVHMKTASPIIRSNSNVRSTNAVNMAPCNINTIPNVPVHTGSVRLPGPNPVQLSRPLPAIPQTLPPKSKPSTPAHTPKLQHVKANVSVNKISPANMLPPQRAP